MHVSVRCLLLFELWINIMKFAELFYLQFMTWYNFDACSYNSANNCMFLDCMQNEVRIIDYMLNLCVSECKYLSDTGYITYTFIHVNTNLLFICE